MAQNKSSTLLNVTLIIFAVVTILYGLLYMFFPQVAVNLSGSEPTHSSWLRWAGATIFALGIGSVLVLQKPANQKIFVTTIALGTLFSGLALLYSLIFEMMPEANTWFTAVPAIVVLVLSILLWWCRSQAKEILGPEKVE